MGFSHCLLQHYTDPIKNYVFHTKRSAALYVETGKVTIRAFVQKTSVHEMYSFEKFTHLVIVPQNFWHFMLVLLSIKQITQLSVVISNNHVHICRYSEKCISSNPSTLKRYI